MRVLVACIVGALAARVHAAPSPRTLTPPRLAPLALYRAERAECRSPGPRLTQFMRVYFGRWLEPAGFGARVLKDWATLSDEQRARFKTAADAKLLAPGRARTIAAFCDKHDELKGILTTASATAEYQHITVWHHQFVRGVDADQFFVRWVLVEQDGQWSLDRIETTYDYPGMDHDPIVPTVRTQLADYEHAMTALGG